MNRGYLIFLAPLLLCGCDKSSPEQRELRGDLNALKSGIASGISIGNFHVQFQKIQGDIDAFRSSVLKVDPTIDDLDVHLELADSAWRIVTQNDCKGYNGTFELNCIKNNPRLVEMLGRLGVPPVGSTATIDQIMKPALATVAKKIDAAIPALKS